jgi:GTP pyrophosphokinase
VETITSSIRPPAAAVLAARERVALFGVREESAAQRALELEKIVATLAIDDDVRIAALLAPLLEGGVLSEANARAQFGAEPLRLAADLGRLGRFGLSTAWSPDQKLSGSQTETLRKMLLAIVTDPRLIILKLADQLLRLRQLKRASSDDQRQAALEARELYAPLANRLGVWQLKWELEDLGFRYLDPENYRRIAAALSTRRADRERSIEDVRAELQAELGKAGVQAEVAGRPKHIYSIWRKMQRKSLGFDQVLDVRAVRVLVGSIADCYAALGVVHGRWPYIPGEFDDYIATPKDNHYRSLHTAVVGPGHEPLEVQIRTREMHEHAELGVAAHWKYKEGGVRDQAYESKIRWVRQLLEPAAGGESDGDFIDRVRAEIFEDRIYVLSPKGEVIDLPRDATPLDFAYHVHTDLGHRCRGAKVNGRMVPLNYRLKNGELVEIITARLPQPSRDWLSAQSGFLASPRSRAKVRAFFRRQDDEQNRVRGRELLEKELARLGQHGVTLPELVSSLRFASGEDLYLALGSGDLTLTQVANAVQRRARPAETTPIVRARPGVSPGSRVVIEQVGNLLSNFARCCRPVPPEPIVGYITLGRGVSVHREDCGSLQRMRSRQPQRVISVAWGEQRDQIFDVDIAIHAFDRRGLVRDISAVLADEKISIQQMSTTTNARENTADVALRVGVHGLEELSRVLSRISGLPNVVRARRAAQGPGRYP